MQIENKKGFTIVELLIVIVVIAILAAIVIVAYNGITRQATDSSIKSDLTSAAKQLESDKILSGNYPVSGSAVNGGQGIRTSGANTYIYNTTPYGYCLEVSNNNRTFRIKSINTIITEGACIATVSTYAGASTSGFVNGSLATARFSGTNGATIDSSGNIFIADSGNHRIRKITPDGTVSTFAGSGAVGTCTAGTGTSAVIGSPFSLSIDTADNIYVVGANRCVMKITPAGVATIMGGVASGYVNGNATVSRFSNPSGTAVDASGNIYVVDRGNHRIRVISPAGIASDFAGSGTAATLDGTGIAARFYYPDGIAIDRTTNVLYVSESSHKIRKIVISTGEVTTVAGSTEGHTDGTGTAAQFSHPTALTVDWSGNIYVAEQDNSHRIRKITSTGVVTTIAGNGSDGYTDGQGTQATFYYPSGLVADASGNLYVASGNTVRKIEL